MDEDYFEQNLRFTSDVLEKDASSEMPVEMKKTIFGSLCQ